VKAHFPELLDVSVAVLTICSLALLTSCMGISSSSPSSQPQVGALSLSSSVLNFGSVNAGSSKALAISATNTGSTPITISSDSISTKYFAETSPPLPVSIAAGQNATITFSFTPNAAAAFNATSTITSDASNSSATISLSGSGIAAGSLGSNPASLNFGSVTVGSTQTLSETVTNSSQSSITISQVAVSGSGFTLGEISTPLTLNAGQSTSFALTFAPMASGSASGNLTITSNASSPSLTIPLSGTAATAGAITSNPSSLAFGTVTVGGTQSLSGTVTNSGGSSVTISKAAANGAGFSLTGITVPLTLNAGQSTTFSVRFAPTVSGSATGNVTITSDASNPSATVPLSGIGATAGAITSKPTTLAFGTVTVGGTQLLSGTLTNSGGSSVTISQAAVSGSGFALSGITVPITLNAGQSTTFAVKFAPTVSGSASGNVTITSTASNPSLSIPLSGIGATAGAITSNPTSLVFGNVTVGGTQSLSGTLTNSGGSSVAVSQMAVSGSGFTLSGVTAPFTLNAGQSTTFTVKFAPTVSGSATGNVTLTSNASNLSLAIPLSGAAVTAGTLGANPGSLAFGTITVGGTQSLSAILTNSGGSSVTISQVAVSGRDFTVSGINAPLMLNAGQSTTFTVKFAPTLSGSATGNVTITSNASNPNLTIPLSGTGATAGTVTANPTSLAFGTVTLGGEQSLPGILTNSGGSGVTVSQAGVSGSGFTLTGITPPITLNAGQSIGFSVSFAPTSSGAASGNVTITSTAVNPTLTIPLSGSGAVAAGQLAVTPTGFNLGSVVVGSSASATGTLTASGANVTVSGASTNNSNFTITGLTLPTTIAAGNSTSFTVTFGPTVSGTASGTLTFSSNAQPSTTTASLTGSGTPAPTHSVSLSWNASTSSNILGYNIYRAVYASACGSFNKINATLDTSTLYTDSSVVNGTSYCYATTGVDTSNQESGYSNVVSNVQIPAQ
jgi:hypothetical protein